ncbi:hypothetical protein ACR6A7_04750 [Pantoea sp. RRHST58]|uniref:hypothetical protein n=1 Tax=Pantoea sp. RRHST58 TaxID=3425183 RepID=UPI003DA1AE44
MSSQQIKLVRIIADIAIALEFTSEKLINPHVVVEMQESIAETLQSLDISDREQIASTFENIAVFYGGKLADYVRSLPVNYRII